MFEIFEHLPFAGLKTGLTLKALIMTAADDKVCDIFPKF